MAAHVHDDAMDERESQAGVVAVAAALNTLFGEEGVENLREVIGIDADARIGEMHHDLVALALGADGDPFFDADVLGFAIGDGVLGITQEVLQRLAKAETRNGGDAAGLEIELQGDAFLVEGRFDGIGEAEDFLGEIAQISTDVAFGTRLAGTGKQALGDVADAVACFS